MQQSRSICRRPVGSQRSGARPRQGWSVGAWALAMLMTVASPALAATISYTGSATVVESVNFPEVPVNTLMTFGFSWDDTSPNLGGLVSGTIEFNFPGLLSASTSGPIALSASSGFSNRFTLSAQTPDYFGFSFIDSIDVVYEGAFADVPSALPPLGTPGYGPLTLYMSSHSINSSLQICLDEPTLPGCDIPRTVRAEATILQRTEPTVVPEPGTMWLTAVGVAAWCRRRLRR